MIEPDSFEARCEEAVGKITYLYLKDGSEVRGRCVAFTRKNEEADGIPTISLASEELENEVFKYKEPEIDRIEWQVEGFIEFSPFEIRCDDVAGKMVRLYLKNGCVVEGKCFGYTRGIDEEDGISNIDIIHPCDKKYGYEYKEPEIDRIEEVDENRNDLTPFESRCAELLGKTVRIYLKNGFVEKGMCHGFNRGIEEMDGTSKINLIHDGWGDVFFVFDEPDIDRIEEEGVIK